MLRAASEGIYGDETWDDEDALAATDYDHELASAYRLGRRGREVFTADRAARAGDIAAAMETPLMLAWGGERRALWDAWLAGLQGGAGTACGLVDEREDCS